LSTESLASGLLWYPPMSDILRTERTFELSSAGALVLERRVAARLPLARQDGWVRTVYLDDADGALSRAIRVNPARSTKWRVRGYGPTPSGGTVWLEVKHRRDLVVHKLRQLIDRASLPAALGSRGLRAIAAVAYRRTAYETAGGAVRITFDRDLCVGAPDADALQVSSWRRLTAARIFEIKLAGGAPIPAWLAEWIPELGDEGYSKAAAALDALSVPGAGAAAVDADLEPLRAAVEPVAARRSAGS
jgi:hypothetical protein